GIFASRIAAVCDEMGAQLRRSAFSPNIRDRLDYSCAVFDAQGELCAQAAHIPVHLGSMAYAMRDIVDQMAWSEGDMVVLNDPFMGGTHLPDVTLIAPVFQQQTRVGFVVNRAHHADIGSDTPGSMPISASLDDEGLLIKPQYILKSGQRVDAFFDRLFAVTRNKTESEGDFSAQIGTNQKGVERLLELINGMGFSAYQRGLNALNDYAERLAKSALQDIPDGCYCFSDIMDDDGLGHVDIKIQVAITVDSGAVLVDFEGTAEQVKGNINCPLPVTAAAVFYALRCFMPPQTPACAGSFRGIKIAARKGLLVNAEYPAAVAAGNVETSTRLVDVVLGALAQAIPDLVPAASHGSMNNVAMGSVGADQAAWDYYETIGGGMGASSQGDGLSALQTHMTNTLNTPIEVLEQRYPLRIRRYEIRRGSGGLGEHNGGDGLVREFEFLAEASCTLLTERRKNAPWGLFGGSDGKTGDNLLNGKNVPGKIEMKMKKGDRLVIKTPGGGGYKSA
ncbi:MAG: hydantoinase B/oxoprolinase family protein, partial [Gammaproteobacteria bacterium]|nr:hydantoinase B/oxoprolinase family protein [Gammaproteobacteria bacterium]